MLRILCIVRKLRIFCALILLCFLFSSISQGNNLRDFDLLEILNNHISARYSMKSFRYGDVKQLQYSGMQKGLGANIGIANQE